MLDVMGLRRPLVHLPPWMPKAVGYVAQLLPKPLLSPAAVDFLTGEAVATTGPLHTAFPELRLRSLREGLTTYLAPRGRRAS
jgi:hypothetical protein